jgi:arginine decarboxylase
MGCAIEYFDVGGGVGINYDGSKSNCPSSTNYSLQDYVGDVVYILKEICDDNKVRHPHIVSESGRVISAHHSCVVTNVFGSIQQTKTYIVDTEKDPDDHLLLRNIKSFYRSLDHSNYQDIYNDAVMIKEETVSAFKLGVINLVERAHIEKIYWSICAKIITLTKNDEHAPKEIANLKYTHADKYLCNFSVFQSTPDSWAINQVLPVIPLTKLNTEPTVECTLADITCDSDGKLSNFIGPEGHQRTLALHELEKDEEYHIGIFLTGAYQDVMGDMHNLFGRLNEVHVYLDDDDPSDFYIEEIIHGHKAKDVLQIMQYNPKEMCKIIKARIDQKIKEGDIRPRVGVELTDLFEDSINSYTYLRY